MIQDPDTNIELFSSLSPLSQFSPEDPTSKAISKAAAREVEIPILSHRRQARLLRGEYAKK